MKRNFIFLLVLVQGLLMFSCNSDDSLNESPEYPDNGMILIGEKAVDNSEMKVRLYAKEDLYSGYNHMEVAVLDEKGLMIKDAKVTLAPMMHMMMDDGMMSHGAPTEQPIAVGNGYYAGAVMFTMPSNGDHGKWSMKINVVDGDEKSHSVDFDLQVVERYPNAVSNGLGETIVRASDMNKSYFISYYFKNEPTVGANDVVFVVYEKMKMAMNMRSAQTEMDDMPEFMPTTDFEFMNVSTYMPSMDHGTSETDVAPKHVANGHYEGIVHFSMTGDWQIIFDGENEAKTIELKEKKFYLEF
ncbi:FixH family protein [Aureibacter tunicatorum]|uniref:YtkA-like domain-containing protein n=1 Tax=Aureibacter tunicatorum TaxID=866807 RepID=A0AAE3XML8_9BACT|nr:FixH family protein [Aureibacter tunicatorum]MDR6238695.1 hypothetical protein [Aureibacter tunicatorum]BDD05374.1 hypothetical protein AUTU_28570 [Aureibacter tunicatorum]